MLVDPRIAGLRADDGMQQVMRQAATRAVRRCRSDEAVRSVLAALDRYAAGDGLADCPALADALASERAARAFLRPYIAQLSALQRRFPLVELSMRHQSARGYHSLELAGRGQVTLGLAVHECAPEAGRCDVAAFPDAERHELVIGGKAEVELLEIRSENGSHARIGRTAKRVASGARMILAGHRQARILRHVHRPLVMLRLVRTAARPLPTRQFAISTGKLLHRAHGDRSESRQELMFALLGRMRRADAAPALAQATLAGSPHLRWQALRECLALDSALGLVALERMAADRADPLFGPASSLRAQLAAAYPQLDRKGHALCPA